MTAKYLLRKFRAKDLDPETKQHSGFIDFKMIEESFRFSSMLTTKETNLLMREYVMKFGYDKINYTTLEQDLIEARF